MSPQAIEAKRAVAASWMRGEFTLKRRMASLALALSAALAFAWPASAENCGSIDLQAHRGSATQPENTTEAMLAAFREGYTTAELDIQRLKTGQWVLHHDILTGRAVKTKASRPVPMLKDVDWEGARAIARDGKVSNITPSFFEDMVNATAPELKAGKKLNVEIKGRFECGAIRAARKVLAEKAPPQSWAFSSVDIEALECIRAVDSKVYLGVVVAPEPDKSLARVRQQIGDMAYRLLRAELRQHGNPEAFYEEIGNRGLLNENGMSRIAELQAGLHIDASTLYRDPEILSIAKKKKVKVYTYYDGNDSGHIRTLSRLKADTGLVPEGMITNEDFDKTCRAIKEAKL